MEDKIKCRTCQKEKKTEYFYETTDKRIDTNGYLAVCKDCINTLYGVFLEETGSMEKAVNKLCRSLNVKFSNEAMEATRANVQTLIDSGKNVNSVFGIFKSKLIATLKSMNKDASEADLTYDDVTTIYVESTAEIKENPIPKTVIDFWGSGISNEDYKFLENEYTNFKKTHVADTYAEITLLKEVCFTLLEIKNTRQAGDDVQKLQKSLQDLMTKLAISPHVKSGGENVEVDSVGMMIAEMEKSEPSQLLKSDPRFDLYRDVYNIEKYFDDYFVRPLRNFILGSRDFNVDESEADNAIFDDDDLELLNSVVQEEDDGEK